VVMKGKPKSIKLRCSLCGKTVPFVPTESPEGYWVCTQCQHRIGNGDIRRIKQIERQRNYL
jgi:DNA-directed RNA polymerase subunit RPC12/RpoP